MLILSVYHATLFWAYSLQAWFPLPETRNITSALSSMTASRQIATIHDGQAFPSTRNVGQDQSRLLRPKSASLQKGTVEGIGEAPMVVMIENYRTGLIWKNVMANPQIESMLRCVGFKVDTPVKDTH